MTKTIYLAGGCFWGVEKYMSLLQGVQATAVGYANGKTKNPSYEQVCRENTGHAETVEVKYNPEVAGLSWLLKMFFDVIDPTTLNKQCGDVGEQYRTGIYYTDPEDRTVIEGVIAELCSGYAAPIVTEVKPLESFYPAEEYHQSYLEKNPQGYCHINIQAFARAKDEIAEV